MAKKVKIIENDIEKNDLENDLAAVVAETQKRINKRAEDTFNALSLKQKEFVSHYLFTPSCRGNFDLAAVKAGYAGSSLPQLKENPKVKAAIEARKKYLKYSETITKTEAVSNLRQLVIDAKTAGNFPAYTKAVEMQLNVARLIGNEAESGSKTSYTQINITAEQRKQIASTLSDLTKKITDKATDND